MMDGNVQLIYFSPECILFLSHWGDMLTTPCYQNNIICLAVDEAHLGEKW